MLVSRKSERESGLISLVHSWKVELERKQHFYSWNSVTKSNEKKIYQGWINNRTGWETKYVNMIIYINYAENWKDNHGAITFCSMIIFIELSLPVIFFLHLNWIMSQWARWEIWFWCSGTFCWSWRRESLSFRANHIS